MFATSATCPPIEVYAPAGAKNITSTGSTCLWVAFVGLFIPCSEENGKRSYHTPSFTMNVIFSTAYLAMTAGYGVVYVYDYRAFFYARYIDWMLTAPLLLLELAGLGGASCDHCLLSPHW